MHEFADQVALVTGASRGIGRQIALKLSSHGAAVILADLSQEDSETVAESIREQGGVALAVPMDVGEPDQVESALACVAEQTWSQEFGDRQHAHWSLCGVGANAPRGRVVVQKCGDI